MLRAPMSLEKMTYDAATGTVIYRSKMLLGLKRNFQVMPGARWLELLCRHIPDRYEHLVRYAGRAGHRPDKGLRIRRGDARRNGRLRAAQAGAARGRLVQRVLRARVTVQRAAAETSVS